MTADNFCGSVGSLQSDGQKAMGAVANLYRLFFSCCFFKRLQTFVAYHTTEYGKFTLSVTGRMLSHEWIEIVVASPKTKRGFPF